jgi:hypothetical protein
MFLALLRSIDNLGSTYNLKLNGNESYKSVFGGILTSFWGFIVLVYAIVQIRTLVIFGNTNTTVQDVYFEPY